MSGKTAALEILFPRLREAGAPLQLGLSRAGDGTTGRQVYRTRVTAKWRLFPNYRWRLLAENRLVRCCPQFRSKSYHFRQD
jgi:hypothetical protein